MNWQWQKFDEFAPRQLYSLMQLRQQVFVVEQDCAYLDADGGDPEALHLLGYDEHSHELQACLRLIKPEVVYPQASIGRVIVALTARGQGLGQVLMQQGMQMSRKLYPDAGICISAQQRLKHFYQELGFYQNSEPYLEDGIPHIQMLSCQFPNEN